VIISVFKPSPFLTYHPDSTRFEINNGIASEAIVGKQRSEEGGEVLTPAPSLFASLSSSVTPLFCHASCSFLLANKCFSTL
jgi:hypothetical protein